MRLLCRVYAGDVGMCGAWGLGFTCWFIAGNGGLEKKTEITMCFRCRAKIHSSNYCLQPVFHLGLQELGLAVLGFKGLTGRCHKF